MVKKAVIIWGYSNSGKTTTIKNLVGVPIRLRNTSFPIMDMKNKIVSVFVMGQSPSEKNETLENLLLNQYKNNLPENIIVAEQTNGINAGNTLDFLIRNDYKITHFVIQNPPQYNHTHWDYNLNGLPSSSVLNKRTEDIRAVFTK